MKKGEKGKEGGREKGKEKRKGEKKMRGKSLNAGIKPTTFYSAAIELQPPDINCMYHTYIS